MARRNKSILAVVIIVVCVALVLGVKYYLSSRSVTALAGRSKGNANAPVKIIEYIDFQCPACASGAKFLRERIQKKPDDIYLEMKYFPLAMHSHAFLSSRFAECASNQNKFWEFHDKLIDTQADWSKQINAFPSFEKFAQELNLDMNQLNVCLADGKVDKVINQHKNEGQKLGIKSTPTYFINHKMVVGPNDLQKEIKALLGE